jgi:hypothetical protein
MKPVKEIVSDKFLREIGIDPDAFYKRDKVRVEDRYMRPTAEYPQGSWLHTVGGEVLAATGYFAKMYPDKPSLYWHNGPPFIVIDTADWEWER